MSPSPDTHTYTHTHTQSGICGLRGLSIGIMVLYCTNCMCYWHTPKLSPHRRLCAFLDKKKTPFSMFFKPFGLRGHRQCPHKPPSCCNTHVIIQICVLITHIYQFLNRTALFPTFFRISSFAFSRTNTFIRVLNYLRMSK